MSGNGAAKRAGCLPSRMVRSSRRETADTDLVSSCGKAHWLGLEPRGAVRLAGKAAAQALLRAVLLGQPSNAARVLVQERVETTPGTAE